LPIRKPVIVVNFKTYPEASGPGALALAKLCAQISSETRAPLIVAPPMLDLAIVASTVKIPVFAQHIDSVQSGSTTGHVTVENAKASGAVGTLVNHSERRIKISEIHEIIAGTGRLAFVVCLCRIGSWYAVLPAVSALSMRTSNIQRSLILLNAMKKQAPHF